jgi:hypothetical protein
MQSKIFAERGAILMFKNEIKGFESRRDDYHKEGKSHVPNHIQGNGLARRDKTKSRVTLMRQPKLPDLQSYLRIRSD